MLKKCLTAVNQTVERSRRKQEPTDTSAGAAEKAADNVAGALSNVPATLQQPSAPAPRRRYGDLECYQCHQKGRTRHHWPNASLNQFPTP